jgi:uncharacterized protein (UPF0335 family)
MSRLYSLIHRTDPEIRTTQEFISFANTYQTYLEIRQRYIYIDDWKRPEQNDIEAYLARNPHEMDKYIERIEKLIKERGELKAQMREILDQAINAVINSKYLESKYQFDKKTIETLKLEPDYKPSTNTKYLNKEQLEYELNLFF